MLRAALEALFAAGARQAGPGEFTKRAFLNGRLDLKMCIRDRIELDLPGYEQFWCYAEKKGYSGTAVFTRVKPLGVSYNLGHEEHDSEGRVITLEYEDFYLVCVYTPNSQDGLKRLDYRMSWEDAFRDYLVELDRIKPVVVCGDMNVAHEEMCIRDRCRCTPERPIGTS